VSDCWSGSGRASPVGHRLRAVFLSRERQRCCRVALVISVVQRVDWRPIAAQHGLANTVEIDDRRGHYVTLLCATGDRFTHKLVR
jgi:hypothetical protein